MESVNSIISKKYLRILYISFFFFFLTAILKSGSLYGAEIIDRIVAQVNDDVITLYDIKRSMALYIEKINESTFSPEQKQEMLNKVMGNVLNDLVETKLTDK